MDVKDIPAGTIGWGARSLVSLNECGAGSWWSIAITPASESTVDYARNISYEPCAALTTGWNIGPTMTGNCESADATTGKGDEEKPVVEETKEESTSSTQQSFDECVQNCYERRKHNGSNEHGIEKSCEAQCKNK